MGGVCVCANPQMLARDSQSQKAQSTLDSGAKPGIWSANWQSRRGSPRQNRNMNLGSVGFNAAILKVMHLASHFHKIEDSKLQIWCPRHADKK